jgi:uncharacterized protein YecT (DUF1311 family)
LLALGLLATAFLSRAWGQESRSPDPCDRGDIAGERICAAEKIETAEKQLAEAFAFALATQREKIAESDGRMKQWQQQLLDAMLKEQETWKEYRDAKCAREGAEDLGLSIGRVFELECVANETKRRLQDLPRAP